MPFDLTLPLLLALSLSALGPDTATGVRTSTHSSPLDTLAAPVVHTFPTGLRVALPPGWGGPVSADETRLPDYARYSVQNRVPGQPTTNVTVTVERVVGLTPIMEQRWRFGQVPYGYGGTRPIAALDVPFTALASYEVVGDGVGGAVAFVQRGRTFWTVRVLAPSRLWREQPSTVLSLLDGVALPL